MTNETGQDCCKHVHTLQSSVVSVHVKEQTSVAIVQSTSHVRVILDFVVTSSLAMSGGSYSFNRSTSVNSSPAAVVVSHRTSLPGPNRVVWTPRTPPSPTAVTSVQNWSTTSPLTPNGNANKYLAPFAPPENGVIDDSETTHNHIDEVKLNGIKPEVGIVAGNGSTFGSTTAAVQNKNGSQKSAHSKRQNGTPRAGNHVTSLRQNGSSSNVADFQVTLCDNNFPDIHSVPSALETTYIDSVATTSEFDHPFFALTDNPTQQEDYMQIVSSKGTVRGVRNRVKAGIAVFVDHQAGIKHKDYRSMESGKVILYTTSVMVVRDTFEKCLRVKKILQTHVVRHEERDVSLSREDHRELFERLGTGAELPQVFADGIHIGGHDEIIRLNENGILRKIFERFKTSPMLAACVKCGGYRYVPCANCRGSKKSTRNHFTKEFCALRCTVCDDNGLVLCDICANDTIASSSF